MSRMTNDVDATKFLAGGGIMLGMNTVLAYLFTIPMMLMLNWQLACVTFLFYPIVIYIMSVISKKVRRGYYDVQEVLADISTVSQENLSGMTVIQSYGREAQENKRFEAICDRYLDVYHTLIQQRILLFMVLAALSGLSMLVVLLVGGHQVIVKQLNWGGFVAFTMYLEALTWPTMALGWTISIFQQGTAALQRIDEVLSTKPNITPSTQTEAESQKALASFQGRLDIRHLTFAYQNPYAGAASLSPSDTSRQAGGDDKVAVLDPSSVGVPTPDKTVLHDINLCIQPGETVALVGPVGSGKSTLLRLLPRLQDVPTGTIFLDEHDITALDVGLLRSLMVFMPQLSFLFSTTVSQNIGFGRPDLLGDDAFLEHESASGLEHALMAAAKTASVHADIQALPNQYETLVGERGLILSGGQRQRVALARAILMDAPILILDDPFSNVDAETERNIVSALSARQVFQEKTTLIATHRFSLISLCDRVVLMDEGRILAVGTPQELLATQPLYQKLYRLQELRASLGDWGMELDAKTAKEPSVSDPFEDDNDMEAL